MKLPYLRNWIFRLEACCTYSPAVRFTTYAHVYYTGNYVPNFWTTTTRYVNAICERPRKSAINATATNAIIIQCYGSVILILFLVFTCTRLLYIHALLFDDWSTLSIDRTRNFDLIKSLTTAVWIEIHHSSVSTVFK